MDYVRSCYEAPCQWYADGGLGRIRYYFVPETNERLTCVNIFAPYANELQINNPAGTGERTGKANRRYYRGTNLNPGRDGSHVHGELKYFAGDQPQPWTGGVAIPLHLLPVCDFPDAAFAGGEGDGTAAMHQPLGAYGDGGGEGDGEALFEFQPAGSAGGGEGDGMALLWQLTGVYGDGGGEGDGTAGQPQPLGAYGDGGGEGDGVAAYAVPLGAYGDGGGEGNGDALQPLYLGPTGDGGGEGDGTAAVPQTLGAYGDGGGEGDGDALQPAYLGPTGDGGGEGDGEATIEEDAMWAWVTFDAAGNILRSKNVSSVTHNGPGDWTVNFTSAAPHANYATFVNGKFTSWPDNAACVCSISRAAGSIATGSVRVSTGYWFGTAWNNFDLEVTTVGVVL